MSGRTAGGLGSDARTDRDRGLRRTSSGAAGRRRPMGGRCVLPSRLRLPRSRGGGRSCNPGLRRPGPLIRCGSGESTPRFCASAVPPNFSPRIPVGSTRIGRIGAARSTAASTPGPSRTGCGSALTSPASSTGSSSTRLSDGGWNCEWVEGSTRSSFHSTLNSLKGLLAYDAATGGSAATHEARHSGEEYLLQRNLFRRLSTGEAVGPWVDQLRLSLPLGLQRAECRRLLSRGFAV